MNNIKDDLKAINALETGGQDYKKWALNFKMFKAQRWIKNLPAKMRDDFRYFVLGKFIFPGYRRPRSRTPETGFFIAESTKEKKNESVS